MLNTLPSQEIMYKAFLEKKSSFAGDFVAGVKTTGSFCSPSCTHKKPKRESIEFFSSAKDALDAGFMPCNRCNPMQSMDEMPGWIEKILKKSEENPTENWTDQEREEKAVTFIYLNTIATPLGPMLIGTTDDTLCLLEFTDRSMLEAQLNRLQKHYNATFVPGSNKIIEQTAREITEYFEGKRRLFSVPMDVPGSEFQKRVWKQLMDIPYGTTRSYKEQAIGIGNLKAIRAVASANGNNRIAIIIPCHRVVGSNGSLTGYAGGLWRKRYLLNLERSGLDEVAEKDGQTSLW